MSAAAAVLGSVAELLVARRGAVDHVAEVLEVLAALEPTVERDLVPAPPHGPELSAALGEMRRAGGRLGEIGRQIAGGAGELRWRVDDGRYYRDDAPVGDGYRDGNMHVVLGEMGGASAGLFLLRAGVDYRDHRHAAPELYLNLAGRPEWRFDGGPWREMAPASVVWNEPGRVHATRSGPTAWLSFWCWTADSDGWCEVVESV